MTLPEKALASFTGHDIEVITSGLVPTDSAGLGTISLICAGGGLSGSGVCFFTEQKVSMVPAVLSSHLQVCFWSSRTRREKNCRE